MKFLSSFSREEKKKAVVATALAVAAFTLGVGDRIVAAQYPERLSHRSLRVDVPGINAAVDSTLARQGLSLKQARTKTVRMKDGTILRRDTEFDVLPSFNSIVFNLLLSRELEEYGATVVGTEHAKEGKTLLHVRKEGVVFRTITFRSVIGNE
jgi:hypothetical protein